MTTTLIGEGGSTVISKAYQLDLDENYPCNEGRATDVVVEATDGGATVHFYLTGVSDDEGTPIAADIILSDFAVAALIEFLQEFGPPAPTP